MLWIPSPQGPEEKVGCNETGRNEYSDVLRREVGNLALRLLRLDIQGAPSTLNRVQEASCGGYILDPILACLWFATLAMCVML